MTAGERGPGLAEQWRRFGAYPPVKRWAARITLAVFAIVIITVVVVVAGGSVVLLVRGGVVLFIMVWRATGW